MSQFSSYLPSKKIVALIVVVLFVGAIFTWLELRDNTTDSSKLFVKSTTPSQTDEARARALALDKDTDGDGLKDWEESLWKTSITNPDTDDDGTSDGAEVALGRDPAVSGPDDLLTATSRIGRTSTTTSELSPIDLASQQFFADFLLLQRSGGLNDNSVKNLVQSFSSQFYTYAGTPLPTTYTRNDIKVSSDTSVTALRNYANAMGVILVAYDDGLDDNKYNIMRIAVDSDDPELLKPLDSLIVAYEKTLVDIGELRVPETVVSEHVQLINQLANSLSDVRALRNVFQNPIAGVGAINRSPDAVRATRTALKNMNAVLSQNNVVFDPEEKGYIFALTANAQEVL